MSELDEENLFEILSHGTRRKLLKILFQESYLSYSELQDHIGQSPGVIYHHLEKLIEKEFIQQRESKEYELTERGLKVVQYLNRLEDDEFEIGIKKNSIRKFFTKIPLAEIIQKNSFHFFIESGLLSLILFFIQMNFSVLIIGPFLIPSFETLESRVFYLLLSIALIFSIAEFLSYLFYRNYQIENDLSFLSSLMVFLLMSLTASNVLSIVNLILSTVPLAFYWAVTITLHGLYYYFLIQFLIKVKKFSVEYSIITSLIIGYSFIILVFLII